MVSRALTMEKTSDKLTKTNQQNDLYNYNLDHVYCSDNSNYHRQTTTTTAHHVNLSTATVTDLKALRKENKQLQAMLLLHLDLIQEQSNQLIAKDKQLLQLREENEQLRLKCERNVAGERRQNNNKYGGSGGGGGTMVTSADKQKNSGSPTVDMYFTPTTTTTHQHRSPIDVDKTKFKPPTKSLVDNIVIDGKRNNIIQPKLTFTVRDDTQNPLTAERHLNVQKGNVLHATKDRPKIVAISRNSGTGDKPVSVKYRAVDSSIIGNNNGKLISKIILQRKKSENGEKIFVRTKSFDVNNAKANVDKWDSVKMIKTEKDDLKETLSLIETNRLPVKSVEPIILEPDSNKIDTNPMVKSLPSLMPASITEPDCIPSPNRESISSPELPNIKLEDDMDDPQFPDSEYNDESNDDPKPDQSSANASPAHHFPRSPPMRTTSIDNTSMQSIGRLSTSTTTTTTSMAPDCRKDDGFGSDQNTTILYPMSKRHVTRNAFLMTRKPYKTREWQLDEIEFETKQQITDEPCKENDENECDLELPKWRTWELSSNRDVPVPREYEDLSDDAFARRHARFLHDERKRKKWDVQRIREQRTIERLKRRHCKDELNQQNICNEIESFFPSIDQLKSIQITDDLPVSAFGEMIPMISPVEFSLPWHSKECADEKSFLLDSTMSTFNFSQIKPNSISGCSGGGGGGGGTESSNVSSIVFLAKKRASRMKTAHLHPIHPIKTST